MTRKVVLLGPQGPTPDVGAVVKDLGIKGPVAHVRAGYQERETDDEALVAALGVPAVNLTLHARGNDVFKHETEFAAAYQARQQRLRQMQGLYHTRLEGTEEAAKRISLRYVDPDLIAQEEKVSVDQYRYMDLDHIERCQAGVATVIRSAMLCAACCCRPWWGHAATEVTIAGVLHEYSSIDGVH